MKKIAMVITQSELGGAQKNILLLCEMLRKEYEITVYSAPGGKMIEVLADLGVNFIPVNSLVREIDLTNDFKAYKFLLNEFKEKSYDIVHCHSSKAGIIARMAASKAKIKNIIFTAHGFVFNEPMNYIKKQIYTFVEWYGARKCHYIICVSPLGIKIAKNKNIKPRKKIVYIPNGINFAESLELRTTYNPFSNFGDDYIFGCVANFYETKGHKFLIEAFNGLISEGFKAKLILIGSGMLIDSMKELSAENPNVIFMGYREDAQNLMKNFDCFVMSSVKEGFPFVLLEAAKARTPIIATDVGAIYEMLDNGSGGIIVPSKDVSALKEAMTYSINNDSKMMDMAKHEYEYAQSNYSLENMCNLTKKVYEEEI